MNLKKILSGALIGAFVFGISAGNIQPVSAASVKDAKTTLDKAKDKFDKNSNGENPPEPPKDENGNPLPPPEKNSDGKTTLDKAKDKYDETKDKYNGVKDKFNRKSDRLK